MDYDDVTLLLVLCGDGMALSIGRGSVWGGSVTKDPDSFTKTKSGFVRVPVEARLILCGYYICSELL